MISVDAIAVLRYELPILAKCQPNHIVTYRIPFFIFSWVYACADDAIGRHCLIYIGSRNKAIFPFIVMYAFDHLGTNKGTFSDDALQGNHMIEMGRTESTGAASKFAEAASVSAIVHLASRQLIKLLASHIGLAYSIRR